MTLHQTQAEIALNQAKRFAFGVSWLRRDYLANSQIFLIYVRELKRSFSSYLTNPDRQQLWDDIFEILEEELNDIESEVVQLLGNAVFHARTTITGNSFYNSDYDFDGDNFGYHDAGEAEFLTEALIEISTILYQLKDNLLDNFM